MKNTPLFVAMAICVSLPMMAQDIPEQADDAGNKVSFVKTSRDTTVYNILDKDRPQNINDIPVPHFAIHTANNNFVMTIGAKINPIIGVDLGSDLYKMDGAGINFIPSQIRVPAAGGRKSDFFINALNADVDLQVVGFGGTRDQITGYIKLSTGGNGKAIKISKAYVTWRGLTAGLKHTLFQDEKVIPPTIDPQGPNGVICTTVNEFAYISPSLSGVRLGIGLDLPTYYTSRGVYLGKDYQSWGGHNIEGTTVCDPDYYSFTCPDIPLFVEYKCKPVRVKLAGIIRPLIYRDVLAEKRRSSVGWGLSLSSVIKPADPVTIYLQGTYGKGIAAYIQDLQGLPLSFVPKDNHPGEMTPAPMMGWMAGLTYNINTRWQFNIMASQARIWDVADYAVNESAGEIGNVNDYKYGYYGATNLFYNISSYFQVGVEYLYGYRKSWNSGSGHDNRIQLQVQFSL